VTKTEALCRLLCFSFASFTRKESARVTYTPHRGPLVDFFKYLVANAGFETSTFCILLLAYWARRAKSMRIHADSKHYLLGSPRGSHWYVIQIWLTIKSLTDLLRQLSHNSGIIRTTTNWQSTVKLVNKWPNQSINQCCRAASKILSQYGSLSGFSSGTGCGSRVCNDRKL
jgi:hypothetical protein